MLSFSRFAGEGGPAQPGRMRAWPTRKSGVVTATMRHRPHPSWLRPDTFSREREKGVAAD